MKPIIINEKTAKRFLKNLQNKKFMVCFVYYRWDYGDGTQRTLIDVAKVRYSEGGKFHISANGSGYMDYIDFEYADSLKCILHVVHSFIECKEPVLNTAP